MYNRKELTLEEIPSKSAAALKAWSSTPYKAKNGIIHPSLFVNIATVNRLQNSVSQNANTVLVYIDQCRTLRCNRCRLWNVSEINPENKLATTVCPCSIIVADEAFRRRTRNKII